MFCTSITRGFNLVSRRSLCSGSISFTTWNIHTLVESAGNDRRICRIRPNTKSCLSLSTGPHCVDRKLDFLVKELKKFDVAVTGIQETKLFGQDVWNVDGYTLLHSGHTLPGDGEPLLKNEGVGIVLDQHATAAWKNAGEAWEAVSSRIVTARLQIVQCRHRRCGGCRWISSKYLSLITAVLLPAFPHFILSIATTSSSERGDHQDSASSPKKAFHPTVLEYVGWLHPVPN